MLICSSSLLNFLILIFFICVILKIYFKFRIESRKSYTCMFKKVIVITGANTGIGFETALELAKRGAKVILACRNPTKAQKALKEIIYETGNENVYYKHLDLASFESVRSFAKDINENEGRIDVLINNAGIGGLDDQKTKDGHLIMIQVNYLSHFLLTHLLIDKLKESAEARIINLTSSLAKRSDLNLKNLNQLTNYSYFKYNYFARKAMYANSKLCMIYFTRELAKKLNAFKITVNAVHPGAILTGIWDIPSLFQPIVKLIGFYYFKSNEEGSRTITYLATSENVGTTTGKLFENCKQVKMYKTAKSEHLSDLLWKLTEKLVNLQQKEML